MMDRRPQRITNAVVGMFLVVMGITHFSGGNPLEVPAILVTPGAFVMSVLGLLGLYCAAFPSKSPRDKNNDG